MVGTHRRCWSPRPRVRGLYRTFGEGVSLGVRVIWKITDSPGGRLDLFLTSSTFEWYSAILATTSEEGMEPTEAVDPELSASPLWNRDLAPTPPSRRTWSTYNIAALWIGMSVVITTYTLASGLMQQGMTWYQALGTILLGNLIVLLPMVLNAHAGTKYGISFPVLCRASFGVKGANVPALLRALVACGWFGIQTWIGGAAIYMIMTTFMPS